MNIDCASPEIKKYIDVAAGLDRIRNNKALYRRMLVMFSQSTEFEAFEAALAANDIQLAANVIHAIKGVSANLAIEEVYKLATQLCDSLRAGIVNQVLIDHYRATLQITLNILTDVVEALNE